MSYHSCCKQYTPISLLSLNQEDHSINREVTIFSLSNCHLKTYFDFTMLFCLVVRSAQPQPNQVQQHPPYQSNAIQQNSFYGTDINPQTQIWNPQCPSQASTSSFHHQSPVIVQQTQQGGVRLNQQQQQQQPIVPQQASSMPMPMVDVNNVIVKQEYPSTVPPIQSNVIQQLPSTLPQQLMSNTVVQSEKTQMRSLRSSNPIQSSDNPQIPVQAAFHSNSTPVNQYPVQQQQQSAALNVPNVINPSNTTIQSNTVFHQQQPLLQQIPQQRIVVQPNSVPANNQSNT